MMIILEQVITHLLFKFDWGDLFTISPVNKRNYVRNCMPLFLLTLRANNARHFRINNGCVVVIATNKFNKGGLFVKTA